MTAAARAVLAAPLFWYVALLAPLLVAALLFVPRLRRPAEAAAAWTPLPMLAIALGAPVGTAVSIDWLLLGARFELDAVGRAFLAFTSVLWVCAGVYLRGYVRAASRRRELIFFHLLTLAGNLGLILAGDLATFYLFFALMSFSAYGLIAHERSAEALRAGRVYLVFTVFGELLLFTGIILTADALGDYALDLSQAPAAIAASGVAPLIASLLLVGFGIKAGAMFLHMWLPLAHPVAPTPSSAVLSGAMIKAGLLGWLRLLPLGVLAMPTLGAIVIGAGIAAAFFGVVMGVHQRNPKTILAYSSISQMGLMSIAVGVALAAPALAPAGVSAAALFAIHHGLAKGALFLGVGVAERADSGRVRWAIALGLVLPALSIAGLPLSSGAIAKQGLATAAYGAPGLWQDFLPLLLSLSSAATLVLLLRFLERVRGRVGHSAERLTASVAGPWAVAAALAVVSLWLVPWLDAHTLVARAISPGAIWGSTWPVFVGVAVYATARILALRVGIGLPPIPPGDILAPLERLLRAVATAAQWTGDVFGDRVPRAAQGRLRTRVQRWGRVFDLEQRAGWTSGMLLLVALTVALAATLLAAL